MTNNDTIAALKSMAHDLALPIHYRKTLDTILTQLEQATPAEETREWLLQAMAHYLDVSPCSLNPEKAKRAIEAVSATPAEAIDTNQSVCNHSPQQHIQTPLFKQPFQRYSLPPVFFALGGEIK